MELGEEKIPEDEDNDCSQQNREVPQDQAERDGVEQEGCGKRPAWNAEVSEDRQDQERGEQERHPNGLRPFEGEKGEGKEGQQGIGRVAESHQVLAWLC